MRADVLDARAYLPAQRLPGAGLDLIDARCGLRLAPALDALEQRARIVARPLPQCRVDVVEVDVGIDVGRYDETSAEVDGLCGLSLEVRAERDEPAIFHEEILRFFCINECGILI